MNKIKNLNKIYIFSILLLLCIISIVILSSDLFARNANFKLVYTISGKAKIVCIADDEPRVEYLYSLELAENQKTFSKHLKVRNTPSSRYSSTRLSVNPAGTKIFIGFTNTIIELDSDNYKILRTLKPSQFINHPEHALRTGFLIASDTTLWFADYKKNNEYASIYECEIISPSKTCKKTKYVYERYNLALERYMNKGFTNLTLFNPNPLLIKEFEMPAEGILLPSFGGYKIIDYKKNNGWLYSSDFLPFKSNMKKFCLLSDTKSPKPNMITTGSCAKWGADGYIYYLKGAGDLWRIDPQNNIKELVFKVPSGSIEVKWALPPMIMSHDRTLIAHKYGENIAIFDLIKKEYRIVDEISGSSCITFINAD